MEFLVGYSTLASAQNRSNEIAITQGCTGDITAYWFGWIKHPDRAEWGLVIPEEYESLLTAEEQALLESYATLDADGWFPDEQQ